MKEGTKDQMKAAFLTRHVGYTKSLLYRNSGRPWIVGERVEQDIRTRVETRPAFSISDILQPEDAPDRKPQTRLNHGNIRGISAAHREGLDIGPTSHRYPDARTQNSVRSSGLGKKFNHKGQRNKGFWFHRSRVVDPETERINSIRY